MTKTKDEIIEVLIENDIEHNQRDRKEELEKLLPASGDEQPAVRTVGRAKPLIEQEADQRAREAELAKQAAKAEKIQRERPDDEVQPTLPPKRIVITERGAGRVHTGKIDPATNRDSFYAAETQLTVSGQIARDLEAKGYAAIIGNG